MQPIAISLQFSFLSGQRCGYSHALEQIIFITSISQVLYNTLQDNYNYDECDPYKQNPNEAITSRALMRKREAAHTPNAYQTQNTTFGVTITH